MHITQENLEVLLTWTLHLRGGGSRSSATSSHSMLSSSNIILFHFKNNNTTPIPPHDSVAHTDIDTLLIKKAPQS
jgi:hypothetical protein